MKNEHWSYIEKQLSDSLSVKQKLISDQEILSTLKLVVEVCIQAFRRGNKILFAGNGGSAADAQHFAAEWVSRFYFDRPGLPSLALTTDTSAITAIGNDYGYQHVFRRQIEALGQAGDIFFAISTSGNSPNILLALEEARNRKLISVGLTGASGGKMAPMTDYCFLVPSQDTPRIQECHGLIGHVICAAVEQQYFRP